MNLVTPGEPRALAPSSPESDLSGDDADGVFGCTQNQGPLVLGGLGGFLGMGGLRGMGGFSY
jgi:hypothetical protein